MPAALSRLLTRTPAVAIAIFVVVFFLPNLGIDIYWQRQLMLVCVYTLLCSGLNLSFGYAGELALGQVAVFATGAYLTAILFKQGYTDLLLAFAVALVAAAVVGLVTGVPGLRLSHWSLALVSFFVVLLIPSLVSVLREYTGGREGLAGIVGPTLFGQQIVGTSFYYVAITVTLIWMLVFRNLVVSRFGSFLQVLSASPMLAETMGGSVYRLKVSAYVIGALPAGLAGVLYAYMTGFVSAEAFSITMLITILAATVLGGANSVWGAPVGAAILIIGPLQQSSFETFSTAAYGAFLIVVGVLFSSGIAGLARRFVRRRQRRRATGRADAEPSSPTELVIPGGRLEISGVTKSFGGLRALDGVDLVVEPGTITAIIGANGAGKTTLLNAISGVLPPDSGRVLLGTTELTGLSTATIAGLGVGRTFQTPLIPGSMSVLEVVETGRLRQGRLGMLPAILRLPRYYRIKRADRNAALASLAFAGLGPLAEHEATSLPLGSRRLLEVVRSVAGEPALLLLDEPAAGLDDDGLRELGTLMKRTRDAGGTVILVEHNVPFVMNIADHVIAMDLGTVVASGSPETVSRDQRVIDSYLGHRGRPPANQHTPAVPSARPEKSR